MAQATPTNLFIDIREPFTLFSSLLEKENIPYQVKNFQSGTTLFPKKYKYQTLFFLQGLPQIGHKKANNLISHFSTLENITFGSEKELGQVKGIGIMTAKAIKDSLTYTYPR